MNFLCQLYWQICYQLHQGWNILLYRIIKKKAYGKKSSEKYVLVLILASLEWCQSHQRALWHTIDSFCLSACTLKNKQKNQLNVLSLLPFGKIRKIIWKSTCKINKKICWPRFISLPEFCCSSDQEIRRSEQEIQRNRHQDQETSCLSHQSCFQCVAITNSKCDAITGVQ